MNELLSLLPTATTTVPDGEPQVIDLTDVSPQDFSLLLQGVLSLSARPASAGPVLTRANPGQAGMPAEGHGKDLPPELAALLAAALPGPPAPPALPGQVQGGPGLLAGSQERAVATRPAPAAPSAPALLPLLAGEGGERPLLDAGTRAALPGSPPGPEGSPSGAVESASPAALRGPAFGALAAAALQSAEPDAQLAIAERVEHPRWGERLGSRVAWMIGNGLQKAQLRLDPPELGPVEVRISLSSEEASVSFHAHHAVVREAIEAALPRLREMLAENGLSLAQAQVSDHGQGATHEGGQGRGGASEAGQGAGAGEAGPTLQGRERQPGALGRGLFDGYA